jgi:hypothetical protein
MLTLATDLVQLSQLLQVLSQCSKPDTKLPNVILRHCPLMCLEILEVKNGQCLSLH